MSTNLQFAISALEILIKESRTAHRGHWNKGRQLQNFKVGDVIKSHIQVHSKGETGEVNKLFYRARGPFQVKIVWETFLMKYNGTMNQNLKYGSTRVQIYTYFPQLSST